MLPTFTFPVLNSTIFLLSPSPLSDAVLGSADSCPHEVPTKSLSKHCECVGICRFLCTALLASSM